MVAEAEEFAEQDSIEKQKVEARNQLEAYLYNLKNSLEDQLKGKLEDDEGETLAKAIEDALIWLEDNPNLDKDDYDSKQKEVEEVANPILKRAYESVNNAADGSDVDGDFMGEDLDGV